MQVVLVLMASLAVLAQGVARPRAYGPGACGPLDPSYVRTATETGGQPFPMSPNEIVKMTTILTESSRSDATMILWAGGHAADADGGFTIPIDPSVTRVTFATTFDGKGGSVEIARPDGTVVAPKASASDDVLNCGRILSVDAPVSGVWRVTPRPTERFWAVVHARSERDLLSTEFVRMGGRPGHEGLFKIQGMPLVGRPATLRVRLTQPDAATPEFTLLSSQGRPLDQVTLNRVDDEEFVGEINLPAVRFRVAVSGTDNAGVRYQRVDRGLFRGETVEVVAASGDTIAGGAQTPMSFIVRNHGGRTRYRITATAGGEILKRIEPPLVELDERTERRITVWLPAATVAAAAGSLELTVVASTEDMTSFNSAFQRVTIGKQ
jgi:hypothetical protein